MKKSTLIILVTVLCLTVLSVSAALAVSVPAHVDQAIRQEYAQKYPDNFSLQKTLIESQKKAYLFLQQYTGEPGVPADVFRRIKANYQQRYPGNYNLQKTLIKSQADAYRELHQ